LALLLIENADKGVRSIRDSRQSLGVMSTLPELTV
jgi:hypothetical protein